MKTQAYLYERRDTGKGVCGICQRRCVIPNGGYGWLRTRVNEGGTLCSLIYGSIKGIARWTRDILGPETPWRVTRFFPYLCCAHLSPLPLDTLEKARTIGKGAGLWYVYPGNAPGHERENTYCHGCDALLIGVVRNRVTDGRCPDCGERIPGRFSTAERAAADSGRPFVEG